MAKIVRDVKEWKTILSSYRKQNKSIGFVPTMGALHQGHLELIKRSAIENDVAVVSIYVNPTQFNNQSDLEKYPKTLEADVELATKAGAQYIFAPTYALLYPENYRYKVTEIEESTILCGAHRPGHFDGVLSVVMKLFNIISPTKAYFGRKDCQQLRLIEGMVDAFFMDIEIVPCEIVRESDGLALSSRNKLLTDDERELAPVLNKELISNKSCSEVADSLEKQGFKVDYIEEHFGRRLGAAFLGNVRLIDNVEA